MSMPSSPPVAACRCCEVAISAARWSEMPFVGIQFGEEDDPALELRNCVCGSTLAIEVQ
jgi:hypothetical protein